MRERKLYTMAEVLDVIPMSQAGIYKACKDGKIPTVRVAKRIFVPSWYIDSLIDKPISI